MEGVEGVGGADGFARLVCDPAVGAVANPLGALAGRFGQQCFQIDGGRGAVLLRRLDGDRPPFGRLQPEPHHRLVDGTDVLHVQCPVRNALAVQHEQLVQHPVHRAVGDARRFDPVVELPTARNFVRTALQKAVAVRIEEHAVSGREPHGAGVGTVVHHAEQREQLRVGDVALVHGVGVERGVGGQTPVQLGEGVGAEEGLVLGQHVPFLRVQYEDEAENEDQEPPVHFVLVALVVPGVGRVEEASQQLLSGEAVSNLEPPQQLVKGMQYLFRQAFADLALVLAALLQQSLEALGRPTQQKPVLAQQQAHGVADRAARRLGHVAHLEVQPARALAFRGRHQAQRGAVAQEPGWRVRLAQQPFHAAVGGDVGTALGALRAVQVLARLALVDQQLPSGLAGTGADGERWAKEVAGVWERNFELGWDGAVAGARVPPWGEAPAEHVGREGAEVRDMRLGLRRRAVLPLHDALLQPLLPFGVPTVENRTPPDQRRSRHDEPGGPDESDPLQVGSDMGSGQFDSGQRYTTPTGSTRRARTW